MSAVRQPFRRRRRGPRLLPGGRAGRRAGAAAAPRLPRLVAPVPRADAAAGDALSRHRARLPRVRLHRRPGGARVRLHLRRAGEDGRRLHRRARPEALRHVRLRLRRAGRLPPHDGPPRAGLRARLAERKRLRGRAGRRLGADPQVLVDPLGGGPQVRRGQRAHLRGDEGRSTWRTCRTPRRSPPRRTASTGPCSQRPGQADIQLDLFLDYATNVDLYPTFQRYLRDHRPPVLAAWGRNDPFFLPAGAEAFRRDVPAADVRFYDTGHFALETHAAEIGPAVRAFLGRVA